MKRPWQQLLSSLSKSNRQKTTLNETSGTKADNRAIGSEKQKVSEQARLYGKKKKKPPNYPQTVISASVTSTISAPTNKIANAAVNVSTQADVPPSLGPTELHLEKPAIVIEIEPLDAIITDEIYYPAENFIRNPKNTMEYIEQYKQLISVIRIGLKDSVDVNFYQELQEQCRILETQFNTLDKKHRDFLQKIYAPYYHPVKSEELLSGVYFKNTMKKILRYNVTVRATAPCPNYH